MSLCLSKYHTNRLLIMRAITLQIQLVRAMGRWPEGSDLSLSGFGTGITVEVRQSGSEYGDGGADYYSVVLIHLTNRN